MGAPSAPIYEMASRKVLRRVGHIGRVMRTRPNNPAYQMKAPIAPACKEAGGPLIILLILTLLAASAGAQPQFNIIYNFTGGADGAEPVGGLIQSVDANLYGVCAA